MRIAFPVQDYHPQKGGAERYTADLVADLAAAGDEVHVYCARSPHGVDPPPGVVVHPLGGHGRGGRGAWRFAVECWRAISAEQFDIVHSVGRTIYHNVYQPHGGTAPATRRANLGLASPMARPLKWLFQDALSVRWQIYRGIEKRAIRRGRKAPPMVIALSRMVRDDLVTDYRIEDSRVRVVYNGVDIERFDPAGIRRMRDYTREKVLDVAPEVPLLVMVAHNYKLKGVHHAIGALAQVVSRGHDAVLAICGRGRRSSFARLARRLRVADRVRWVGDTSTVQDFYGAADVFVHPTAYDPCSLVLLEALAAGLPAISTSKNGASELITDGVDGCVLSEASAEALAERLEPLLADAGKRERMGAAARQLAQQHTRARNAEEIRAVYREVVELGIQPEPRW